MSDRQSSGFSVAALFAERNAKKQAEREQEEKLLRRKEEELAAFKRRLEAFQITDEHIKAVQQRIRRAFDRGETELMLTSFPSDFCSDGGRAIINANEPTINPPSRQEAESMKEAEPAWLATLPAGARPVFRYWKSELKPAGFDFSVRIMNYPGGKPGDVGMFLSWPKTLD